MLTRRAAAVLLAAALLPGCAADPESAGDAASAVTAIPTTTTAPSPPAASASPSAEAVAAPSPSEPAVRTVSVRYAGGQVAGTSGREEVALGEQVVLRFVSDVAEEIHVHGYDLEAALPAGATVDVPLTADIPGVFEVELHESGKVLYQLRVS